VALLLTDLDNTLVDRAAAFHRWADRFAAAHRATGQDVDWLVEADGDGLTPRDELAARIRDRFGLDRAGLDGVRAELKLGMADYLSLDSEVTAALRAARAAGWTPIVITNGATAQQERKLRLTGLDQQVAGWVISEEAGVRKPDPRIFQLAAQQAGQSLEGAWMIGDSAAADIAGAHRSGLPSIWLDRGRRWPAEAPRPTMVAASFPAAVTALLATGR
jgi:putative hydrolase of the HAD superfamily